MTNDAIQPQPEVTLPPQGWRLSRFGRYLRAVAVELTLHPEWRPGQAFVNVTTLHEEFRDLPSGIMTDDQPPALADEFDPWNHDERVPRFLAALEAHWRTR